MMSSEGLFAVKVSGFFRTPAFPAGSGPDFVNAAMCCETLLSGDQVLRLLHKIEASLGRERSKLSKRWGARVIDLDLIDFDGAVVPDLETQSQWRDLPLDQQMVQAPDQMILPHPRVQDRLFVLIPLQDVAPEWCHPVLGLGLDEMIEKFDGAALAEIQRLTGADRAKE